MEAEGLKEDGVGVGEGGRGELGGVEGEERVGAGGGGRAVRVKHGLDLVADFGVNVAVLEEEVESPCE